MDTKKLNSKITESISIVAASPMAKRSQFLAVESSPEKENHSDRADKSDSDFMEDAIPKTIAQVKQEIQQNVSNPSLKAVKKDNKSLKALLNDSRGPNRHWSSRKPLREGLKKVQRFDLDGV